MPVQSYRELIAWQKSMDLVVAVYRLTERFPGSEAFGLTNQIRRAAVSIPSNIAEGQGRRSPKEFQRFLNIAYGSLQEVETQVILAARLNFIDKPAERDMLNLCAEVGRLINGLLRAVSS